MLSIEESIKEYEAMFQGKPNEVEVVTRTIPIRPEFSAETIKELRKKHWYHTSNFSKSCWSINQNC